MSNLYSEIEVKLHVPDFGAVAARLDELGATIKRPRTYERNLRYQDAAQTFHESGVILRLRQDDRARLTYKEPMDSEAATRGLHDRFEVEVVVDDYNAMHTILARLGFHAYMIYEKYRTTYHYGGAEVVLDEMPYGNFVEVEGDESTINKVLGALNLQDAHRIPHSYGQLFAHIRHNMQLTFTDLTFENFRGLNVPASAWQSPTEENNA